MGLGGRGREVLGKVFGRGDVYDLVGHGGLGCGRRMVVRLLKPLLLCGWARGRPL